MASSMRFTIGTALDRAHQNGLHVRLLVEGEWISGRVAWVDDQGVLVVTDSDEHAVVRLASVSAVRVASAAPVGRALDGVGAGVSRGREW
ncbi:MAG: hypothetical protein ACRDOJ_06705 [Nocardioidaceae bacterium]